MPSFKNIDFRNCRYQGQTSESNIQQHTVPEGVIHLKSANNHQNTYQPQGEGILIDDSLRFIIGTWNKGYLQGNTLVFDSHEKYIYGPWKNGFPDGVNVYRGGETLFIANFENGKIIGSFIVIFQAQGFLLTARLENQKAIIVQKIENVTSEQVIRSANQIGFTQNFQELTCLMKFVQKSFGKSTSGIKLCNYDKLNYLGIQNGLGIVFDGDNFIHKVGHISKEMKIQTIGGVYTGNISKVGDFQNQLVVQYRSEKGPSQDLGSILKQAHLRSINFTNQYLFTNVKQILNQISKTLKQCVVPQILKNKFQDSRRLNIEDIQDSLEYHQKHNSENYRLKEMKAELYLAIGRPGSQIKPVKKQTIKQFLADEDHQKAERLQRMNRYNISSKAYYKQTQFDTDYKKKPISKFQISDYKKSSPVRLERSKSPYFYQLDSQKNNSNIHAKIEKEIQEIKRIPSRSPLKLKSNQNNNKYAYCYSPHILPGPTMTMGSKSSATFGNKPSCSFIKPSQTKYQEVRQRRSQLLNQYKGVCHESSPTKLSPLKSSDNFLYQSPYRGRKQVSKYLVKQGNETDALLRLQQRHLASVHRSPHKYSYLNSFI